MKKLLKKLSVFALCASMFVGAVVGLTACGDGNKPAPEPNPPIVQPVDPTPEVPVTPVDPTPENPNPENPNPENPNPENPNPGPVDPNPENPNPGPVDPTPGPGEEITVTPNKYAGIVEALEVKMAEDYKNPEILSIYEYNNYLACKVKTDDGLYSVRTRIKTSDNSLTADKINESYYTSEIPGTRLTLLDTVVKGAYTSENSTMVQEMVDKLVGNGYTIMWGTISNTRDQGTTTGLGNAAEFDVYALLEKDGVVSEYSETVTATKELGDVYQAVLNSTEANKNSVYKSGEKTPAELGAVANGYLAEENRVAEEEAKKEAAGTQVQTASYKFVVEYEDSNGQKQVEEIGLSM